MQGQTTYTVYFDWQAFLRDFPYSHDELCRVCGLKKTNKGIFVRYQEDFKIGKKALSKLEAHLSIRLDKYCYDKLSDILR
jgi:hypothetical protein